MYRIGTASYRFVREWQWQWRSRGKRTTYTRPPYGGLPGRGLRRRTAKMSPRPEWTTPELTPCQYRNSPLVENRTLVLSLSLSFGGPGLMILPGNPRRMKRGRRRDEGEGERKGRAGISVSSRWNRAENGKSSDLVTNGWSTVGWSLASNRCVRIGKGEGKERPSLRGEYTAVIANEKVLFLRNFYKFILRACVLFASHSLKSKCLFSFSFFSRKVYFLFLKKFYIKLIFVILVCKIFIFMWNSINWVYSIKFIKIITITQIILYFEN